jgi:hypothetical protein
VVKIPNAALRFKPRAEPAAGRPAEPGEHPKQPGSRVWVQESPGGALVPIAVTTGITDGQFTELTDPGSLKEEQNVVVGLAEAGNSPGNNTVNPFGPPRLPRGPRPR